MTATYQTISKADLDEERKDVDQGEIELQVVTKIEPTELKGSAPILSWKDIVVTSTQTHRKYARILDDWLFQGQNKVDLAGSKILKGISGQITGGLWAIMGESGSGKTTLLNVLARRLDILRMHASGETRVNGHKYNETDLKSFAGYVMQDDVVNAKFTVYETLYYSAALRLSGVLNHEEREERIYETMRLLEIEHCKDVLVGDSRHKGISGGERKRLCIAIELLTKPTLLFLDEPTSGLDSSTALHLITILRRITDKNETTILTTIHQPPSKVFNLLENLILLRNGECLYHGSTAGSIQHFTNLGFPFNEDENPADHIVHIISDNTHNKQTGEEIPSPVPIAHVEVNVDFGKERDPPKPRVQTPWHLQFWHLFERGFLEQYRNKERFIIGIVATLIVATFISQGVWKHIGNYQNSIELRRPALYFVAVFQGVVCCFLGAVTYPADRALMLRERQSGTYRVSAYYLAKSTVETILEIPQLIIFCLITYYEIGFREGGRHFMIYASFITLSNISATSLTNAISCLSVSIELTTVITAFTFEISRMYGGWFLNPLQIRQFKKWQFFSATNYVKYAFFGIALNEFTDLPLECRPSELKKGKCPYTDGSQVLHVYGYDLFDMPFCCGMLILIILTYKIATYVALKYIKF